MQHVTITTVQTQLNFTTFFIQCFMQENQLLNQTMVVDCDWLSQGCMGEAQTAKIAQYGNCTSFCKVT